MIYRIVEMTMVGKGKYCNYVRYVSVQFYNSHIECLLI